MSRDTFEPKVIYRIFGDQKPSDLLPLISLGYKDRVVILTTTDYGQDNIDVIRSMGFEVVPSKMTNKEAGENSASFLNDGLRYMKECGNKYVILMASGFQGSLSIIDKNIFQKTYREHPNQDVYFVLTNDIHGVKPISDENVYKNRKHFFPSESLALVKIDSIFPLNVELTIKGALGNTPDGKPLGGIELLLTIMSKYKSDGHVLNMCGIESTIVREPMVFAHELDKNEYELVSHGGSVEYTPNEVKVGRREATIDAAMQKIGMSENEYRDIFSKTEIIEGF